ncbi:MAG TPA: hydrogenase maturation protease [Planctomycetota bacterium]|nr:hydrogenase maturation protease [Planctomycetota bacterium]
MTDDGIGPAVVRCLRDDGLGPGVLAVDACTALVDALDLVPSGADVLVVDAVSGGGAPGTVYRIPLGDLAAQRAVTLHDPSLPEAFAMARLSGASFGTVTVLGVEPARVAPGAELSPVLAQRLPAIVETVRGEIERLSGLTRAR